MSSGGRRDAGSGTLAKLDIAGLGAEKFIRALSSKAAASNSRGVWIEASSETGEH